MQIFKFVDSNDKRRQKWQKLAEDIKTIGAVKLAIAVILALLSPLLGVWIGAAGIMSFGLAGGVRLARYALPHTQAKFHAQRRNTGLFGTKMFRRLGSTHNHARAGRTASRRSTFAKAGGDGGDDDGSGADPDLGGRPMALLTLAGEVAL